MSEWNAMTYEGKDTILRVVRARGRAVLRAGRAARTPGTRADRLRPAGRPATSSAHIVDTTEGYFRAFDAARSGTGARRTPSRPAGHGTRRRTRARPRSADVPQAELMERLRDDFHKMQEHARAARPGRLDRADGHPRLHGSGAGVLLRRRPADGLRRPLVGHPRRAAGAATRCPATPPTCWCRSCSRSGRARSAPTRSPSRSRSASGSAAATPATTGSRSTDERPDLRAGRDREPAGVHRVRRGQPGADARSAAATPARSAATSTLAERYLNLFFRI